MEGTEEHKKGLLEKIQLKDVTLAILCGIAIYLLRAKEQYTLKPVWRHDILPNETFWSKYQLLPVITDLEGDGHAEIVVVTTSGDLVVLLPEKEEVQSKILPHVKVKHYTKLPKFLNEEDPQVMIPVAMDMGYLVPYSSVDSRFQVIVVVFNNWHVMCFRHDLQLLWQQSLGSLRSSLGQYEAQAFAVLVIPHTLHGQGTGSVIIGGSFEHESHHPGVHSQQKQKREYRGLRGAASATPGKVSPSAEDKLKHFSSFALNGHNGSVVWHHLPGDFEDHTQVVEPEEEAFHWKLKLKKHSLHVGESHWTKYRQDLMHALPHRWQDISDTRIELANIKSSDRGVQMEEEVETNTLSNLLGLPHFHVVGKTYGGMKPHTRQEHVSNPNVLVIYHHRGLEVLNIQTGQPLTQINMQMSLSTYGDVNKDGYLDQVVSSFNNDCTGIVMTVDDVEEVLFKGPLCDSPGWIGSISMTNTMFPDHKVSEDTHLAVPPLIVPSVAAQTGFLRHLQGYSLASNRKGSDTVFLTSNGRITSYSPRGEFNWQVRTNAGWADIAGQSQKNYLRDQDKETYEKSFRPSMVPLPLKIFGQQDAIVVSGWSSMSLVSLKDGSVLADHSLPCQPSIKPATADFNNDGYTDVIVACHFGYIGFAVQPVMNLWYTAVVSVGVVLMMVVLHWTCVASSPEDERLRELN